MPYSTPPSFVLGFRGCDASLAKKIVLRKQRLTPTNTAYDWLGAGIYFWEDNPRRALDWAIRLQARGRIRKPVVIGALIDPGMCLNLLDPPDLQLVQETYRELLTSSAAVGSQVARSDSLGGEKALLLSSLGCEAINKVHHKREVEGHMPYDTVRAAFVDGGPPPKPGKYSELTPVQICVRNPRCIQAYFFPADKIEV